MFKKISFSILILMLLVVIPINIKATTNVLQVSNTSFSVLRGEEFETTIYIEEGSNVTGLNLTINYDKELVTLEDYEEIDASEINVIDNTIIIIYSGVDNISEQLDLVKLTFKVEEQIGVGNYDKWLYWSEHEEDEAFTTTGFEGGEPNYSDLTIETSFTSFNIRTKGDAYNNKGDGKINARDASYVLQHAAHMFTMSKVNQYYANVYEDYDASGNPKISARDASLILQHAAHMDVKLNDRYEIVFYTLNENNEYVEYIKKSVKEGTALTSLPKLDSEVTWSLSSEEYIEVDFNNITADLEVYALDKDIETPITYEIKFDSDGAGTYEPITVVFNQKIDLPQDLTKEGYTFVGWYLNEEFLGESFVFTYPFSFTIKAKWRSNTVTLEELQYNGTAVKYRNTNTAVEIPSDYIQPKEQLRATWVTSFASTFSPSPVEATMKHNLTEVLNLLEEYNMNCMIFHIRTTNNAFYPTDLAPISSAYGTKESFEEWDYLEWLIDECHKRGIEFHAWLNPYRIKAYGYSFDATEETVAAQYANYPLNPASDPENILMTYRSDGTQGAILNPYEEEVQDYIVDVCLEVMEKYDVDAIHFDDYFYAQMSSGINVLREPDQDDYEEYINNNPNCGYSKSNGSHKKQWRRDNIDKFIYKLHNAMTEYNKEHGRGVQLGISPTGIYRNGNGSVESGSNTAGQEHYSSYLFCDTMNWVRNEWIDYIMPQSYWAFTHSVAGYADVMDWWNAAVDGTRVNLYSGLGLYMSISGGNYSWGVQPYEISNQVLYTTKLKNVKGVSIYSQLSLKQGNSSSSRICYEGLMRLKNEYWNTKVPTPKTMAHQYIK